MADGSGLGVDDGDCAIIELGSGLDGGVVGAAELAGDGDADDLIAGVDQWLKRRGEIAGGGLGGAGELRRGLETLVELGRVDINALAERFLAEQDVGGDESDPQLFDVFAGDVAGAVGNDF